MGHEQMNDGDLAVGTVIGGFRVEQPVGRGGMSVLYRAVDLSLGRPVALKVMAPWLVEDPDFRARFMKEARSASSIDHPNVIPLYASGESEGRLFIAMRFVPDARDLRKL